MKKIFLLFLFVLALLGFNIESKATGEQYVKAYNELANAVNQRIEYTEIFNLKSIDIPQNQIFSYPEFRKTEEHNIRVSIAASQYGKVFFSNKYTWNSVSQSDLESIRSRVVSLARNNYLLDDAVHIPQGGIQSDDTATCFLNAIHDNTGFETIMSGIGNGRDKFTKIPSEYVNGNKTIYSASFTNAPLLWIHFTEIGEVIEKLKWMKKSASWSDSMLRRASADSWHGISVSGVSGFTGCSWQSYPSSLGDAKNAWGSNASWINGGSSPTWSVSYVKSLVVGSGIDSFNVYSSETSSIRSKLFITLNSFIDGTGSFYTISKKSIIFGSPSPLERKMEKISVKSLSDSKAYSDLINDLKVPPSDIPVEEPISNTTCGFRNDWLSPYYVHSLKDPKKPDLKDPAKDDSPADGLLATGCTCTSCKNSFEYEFKQFSKCVEVKFPLGMSDGNINGLKVKAYIAAHANPDLRKDMYSLETCVSADMSGMDLDENNNQRTWEFALVRRPTGTEVLFALSGQMRGFPDNGLSYRMEKFTPGTQESVYHEITFPSSDVTIIHKFGDGGFITQCRQKKGEDEIVLNSTEVGEWPGLQTNYSNGPGSKISSVISPAFNACNLVYNDWYGGLFFVNSVDYKDKSNKLVQRLVGSVSCSQIVLSSYYFNESAASILESRKVVSFSSETGDVTEKEFAINGGVVEAVPVQTVSYVESLTKEGLRKNTTITIIGQDESKSETIYGKFSWGEEVIAEIIAPNSAAEKRTTYAYYENQAGLGYRKTKSVASNDGSWTRYEYDAAGRTIRVITPFVAGNVDTNVNLARVTEYTYSATNPKDFSPTKIIQMALGAEISRSYCLSSSGESRQIRAAFSGAAPDAAGNLITVTEFYTAGDFKGRPRKITNPDGIITVFIYAPDTLTTTVESGSGSGYSVTDGMRSVTVMDAKGSTISSATYDIASGILLSSAAYARDAFGRVVRVDYNDGTHTETTYGCCGPESERDREGIVTTIAYDVLKRVTFTVRGGVTTFYSYDASGNVTSSTRKGSDNTEITTSSEYDASGTLIATTDPVGNRTSYSPTTRDGRRTTTYPDGSTSIVRTNVDGSTAELYGTGVHGVKYEYGVENGQIYTKSYPTAIPTQWTKSYTDFLGRGYKTLFADGTQLLTYYDSFGRPVKQVSAGHSTLSEYNQKGELARSAVDMNGNGVIDNAVDKVTQYSNIITSENGTNVRRQAVTVNSVVMSVSDVSLDGLRSCQTSFGRESSSIIMRNGANRTVTATDPDGSTITQTYQNGLLITSAHSVLGTTTYTYDAHNRLSSSSHTNGNGLQTTAYLYDKNDCLIQTTENGSRITGYTYDSMGRMTKMTRPDGRTVNYSFSPTGELAGIKGAGAYPVSYAYDGVGRMKALTDGNGSRTTWNYSADRGFMTSKEYPDGGAVSYAYNPDGSASSRTWERGVVTSYAYNAAGELTGVTYGGGAASPVTFTRDIFGRPTAIVDGTGSRTISYNNDSTISSETSPNIASRSVNYSYDNLGRRTLMSLTANSSQLSAVSYTYDGMSRLASVGNGARTAGYTRIPGSNLLSTTSIGNLTVSRAYDNINRLTSIGTAGILPAASVSYSYDYNNSDQRTKLTLSDGSYWVYRYDQYGQVSAAHKYNAAGVLVPGQQFDYSFDSIGNRKTEKRNGSVSEYNANNLNQYTQRTIPGTVSVSGSADETAEVRIKQESQGANGIFKPERVGKYFRKEFSLDNSSTAVEDIFDIYAVKYDSTQKKDIVAKQIEKLFLPKTPELFTYDPDGNLTSDGRFTYTWDGENRLVSLESGTGVSPVNRIKVDFTYDYMGRRISKKSYSWSSTTNSYELSATSKYAWDGWSLIAVFDGNNTLKHSYTWGADGLISDTDVSNGKTYIPVYDGNSNIVAYVDSSNSLKVAEFEYDAFGRCIVKSGTKADDFAFRFSSYQFDAETGLVYYGYRYYNPETGRWLNRDKIAERGGLNLYGTGNDFINYSDDLGLALYAFDGTGNNQDKLSGHTNIWHLWKAYNSSNAFYMQGVGTGNSFDQIYGGITGEGGQTRLEEMYDLLVKTYQGGDQTIDIIGFSRGAALARTFANLIKSKGIKTGGFYNAWAGNGSLYKEADKFKCVRIRFLGLFDTVASFGVPGNDTNIGYNLTIPDIVDHTAHATARDEMRGTFPLSSIYSLGGKIDIKHRIEKSFPGVHSDVGGGYRDHPEAQYGPLKWMWQQGNEAASQSGKSPNPMFNALPDSIENYLKSPSSKNPYTHDSRLDENGKYQNEYIFDVYKKIGERNIYYMGDN